MTTVRTIPQVDRKARFAVNAMFFTNGAIVANVLPRYPEIKAALGLGNTVYGFAVAAMPVGAIVAGLTAAWFIRRFTSARVATYGTMLASLFVLAAGVSPSLALFAGALFAVGAADAIIDVAQNAHGLRVQRRYGSSIINSFHAFWSMGAVAGGLMAAAAIALRLPLAVHLSISALLFTVVAVVAQRNALPGHDGDERAVADPHELADKVRRGISPRIIALLAALSLISISGSVVEDLGNSWATLYLQTLGAPAALAAFGFVSLVGAQFVGRILGDRMVDHWGERAVARFGGVLIAVGMGLALAWPSVPGTVLGFAAAGFGCATFVPAAMHAGDNLPGLRAGTGLTIVSWLLRVGFLVSPPIVGAVADNVSLRMGLLIVPVAGIFVVFLSAVLQGRRLAR
ncbi:MFS transporter [Tessaracoccus sp. ZS01]|uniref:MFS transporter n=1 Tax=Tessaracoccus sp. ZS01 TaxID=1906324 RepID=UPI00096CACDE|nr:MFS transporter [Tessaracoccus sp. ZS01]MCG6566764.1 MFS transporter [Tessaracoccus sp. ZS01]OMG57909.1 MFS transporter [Tessaracoccus sp. ZS01]